MLIQSKEKRYTCVMKRNVGVDLFRDCSLLLVLWYHCWVLSGERSFSNKVFDTISRLGGEIGVTAFFLLSGFGIYLSIKNMEVEGRINYLFFVRKRVLRIIPPYYFCLLVSVLFLNREFIFSRQAFWDITTHLLFIHNWFPPFFGSINGVFWTLGVIVQFYFISFFMYRMVNKHPALFMIAVILLTVMSKMFFYSTILPMIPNPDTVRFFLGRQLLTSIDNFGLGMLVAYHTSNRCRKGKITNILLLVISLYALYFFCNYGLVYGIHTTNFSGYIWHSLIAISIAGILYVCSQSQFAAESWFVKTILRLSKNEYCIYLWHLLLMRKVLEGPLYDIIISNSSYYWPSCFCAVLLTIIFGAAMTWLNEVILRFLRYVKYTYL